MKHFFLLSDGKRSGKRNDIKDPAPFPEIQEAAYPANNNINRSDSSEFLNEAIRMKELLLENNRSGQKWNYSERVEF